MWTYLAYILHVYATIKNKTEITVKELYSFHSSILIPYQHLSFWENLNDMMCDIKYLSKLGLIKIKHEPVDNIVMVNLQGLKEIYQIVRVEIPQPSTFQTPIFNQYKQRVDNALNQWLLKSTIIESIHTSDDLLNSPKFEQNP